MKNTTRFILLLLIILSLTGCFDVNIGSNVMTIMPLASVGSATQEVEWTVTSTTSPQSDGGTFSESVLGLVFVVGAAVAWHHWKNGTVEKYL